MGRAAYITLFILLTGSVLHASDTVVLLHGLARSAASMEKMEASLEQAGYSVLNIDYPSRQFTVEELSGQVRARIRDAETTTGRIHFVTHSMGGILLRYIQRNDPVENLGRVVMLSPPNRGSEVVDALSGFFLFKAINGPSGNQLGTGDDSVPAQLGPVDFELGVLTGDRSINWILSLLIPGKDDGKVSVERARVEGMRAFKVVHATHPFIMQRPLVIRDVIHFLRTGKFSEDAY